MQNQMLNKASIDSRKKRFFYRLLTFPVVLLAILISATTLGTNTAVAMSIEPHAMLGYNELGYGLYGITSEEYSQMLSGNSKPISAANFSLDSLDSNIDLSTKKFFPPIRDQSAGSCVAWATTYYQFTYQVAKLNNWDAKNDDSKVFSPKYVYNFNNAGKDNGCHFADCYYMLKRQGSLKWN